MNLALCYFFSEQITYKSGLMLFLLRTNDIQIRPYVIGVHGRVLGAHGRVLGAHGRALWRSWALNIFKRLQIFKNIC